MQRILLLKTLGVIALVRSDPALHWVGFSGGSSLCLDSGTSSPPVGRPIFNFITFLFIWTISTTQTFRYRKRKRKIAYQKTFFRSPFSNEYFFSSRSIFSGRSPLSIGRSLYYGWRKMSNYHLHRPILDLDRIPQAHSKALFRSIL